MSHKIDYTTIITELYDGSSTGTITLSESAANFDYIRIFFRNGNNYYSSIDVYSPNGKSVSLNASAVTSSGETWKQHTIKNISGTSITNVYYREVEVSISGSVTSLSNNKIYITRVEGFNIG